ncbi:uncharacterized protein LOC144105552 isoform X2 [Amblyomma americanum]
MVPFVTSALVAACTLLLAFPLASCKAKHQLEHETMVDAFKALAISPYGVALYDIDKDGDLDCLAATRTEFSMDPPRATYILAFKGANGHITNFTYHLRQGPTPDTNVVVINNDNDHPLTNHYFYSDYKNCIVLEFPILNHQECVLWVTRAATENTPQICIDQFQDNCDDGTLTYDKDTCADMVL